MATLDYSTMAQHALTTMMWNGLLEGVRPDEVPEYLRSYSAWLESYVTLVLQQELERLGKARELCHALGFAPEARDSYLRPVIPNYDAFVSQSVHSALRALTGVVGVWI